MATENVEVSIGPLQQIIERRKPESAYHKRCMAVLDRSTPSDILQLLVDSRLAIVEAAAAAEKEVFYGHEALVMLSTKIFGQLLSPHWNSDVWQAAVNANDIASIQDHFNRLPEEDGGESALFRRAVGAFVSLCFYRDCIRGASVNNIEYYLSILLMHVEVALKGAFLYVNDNDATDDDGDWHLPDGFAEWLLSIIEETIEDIIRDATTERDSG